MSKTIRTRVLGALLVVALIGGVAIFFARPFSGSTPTAGLNQVISDAKAGNVSAIQVEGDTVSVKLKSGESYDAHKETDSSLLKILDKSGVDASAIPIEIKKAGTSPISLILVFLPILVFGGLILFIIRRSQGANSQISAFGRSKARVS